MWCAVVFWSVLSLKIWNIYDEKLREAGKWWGRFCNTTNWIKIVSYFPVCTELVIDIEKKRLLSPFYLLVTLVATIVIQIKYLSKLTALTSILLLLSFREILHFPLKHNFFRNNFAKKNAGGGGTLKQSNRPFAPRGHVTSFLWKWKLYDFAFEKRLVGHILNKIIVIWFFKLAAFS